MLHFHPALAPAIPGRRGRLEAVGMRRAFTLVELLVVIGIILIVSALVVPAVTQLSTAGDVTHSLYDLTSVLEEARTYAVANNTYTWVGFFEEDATLSTHAAGVGRVVLSTVASRTATQLYPSGGATGASSSWNSTNMVQVGKLTKLERTHLDDFSAVLTPTRPQVGPADQVGNTTSGGFSYLNGTQNATVFYYPLGAASSAAAQYTFYSIIQFNPLGDASKIVDTPVPFIEIGMRPARGNVADTGSKNYAAVQVAGIGGQISVYRP